LIRRDYLLARDFPNFLYGAQPRHNCVFFESISIEKGRFKSEYADWLSQGYEDIDLSAILHRANCLETDPASAFLRAYARLLADGNREAEIGELIIRRERQIKFSRAKLKKPIQEEHTRRNRQKQSGVPLRHTVRMKLPASCLASGRCSRFYRSWKMPSPGRKFMLDDHLVGSIGEVLAAYHYGLELLPTSAQWHDATARDGRMYSSRPCRGQAMLPCAANRNT